MASRARIKRVAQWVQKTAIPSPDSSVAVLTIPECEPDDSDDIDRVIAGRKKFRPDARQRRPRSPPEPGTGGLESDDSESEDDGKRDDEEEMEREDDDDEGEEECSEFESESEEEKSESESDEGDGSYPAKKKGPRRKPRTVLSPESASCKSGESSKRLQWKFLADVDLSHKKQAKRYIEEHMRRQMIIAGKCKMNTTDDEKTIAGWKLRRVRILLHFIFITIFMFGKLI